MEYIPAKTIVTRTKNTAWFGTRYNMNIYKGCSHGCIYCDSRSDCYRVSEFDRVRAKENALTIIRDDLAAKTVNGVIATGSMSDPYNPLEKEHLLTRHALELVSAYGFGVAVATKSDLICRDIDLLREIAVSAPVLCKIAVTTANEELCKKIEPRAPSAVRRFAAVEQLAKEGIFTGILLMPVLPFLEDSEANVGAVVHMAKESGARFIYPMMGVTLRGNQRAYFYEQLEKQFPEQGLAARYAARYGDRYACYSSRARQLYAFFKAQCDQAGLLYDMREIVRAYQMGYQQEQLTFW